MPLSNLPRTMVGIFAVMSSILTVVVLTSLTYSPSLLTWKLSTDDSLPTQSATSGRLFLGERVRTFPSSQIKFSSGWVPSAIVPNRHQSCKYWSVVTTIFDPSDSVRRQANLGPDWCIVVVGDRKSPPVYPLTGSSQLVYLDVPAQESYALRFPEFINALSWNHFGRKNVGFLYAIEQGAKSIWDFDDDNLLKDGIDIINPDDEVIVEVDVPEQDGFPTYNPYIHFGAPHFPSWPRGIPLTHIKEPGSYNATMTRSKVRGADIGLIQSLADHDPDMDAIYRLVQPLPFTFQTSSSAPIVVLPPNTLAPLNAQACLFKRSAFWMLLLPITVHGRVSDIWRGYAGQRLLSDIGLVASFSPPIVDQFRNPHNYLADFDSEIPLYTRSGAMIDYLRGFDQASDSLPERMEQVSIGLYERGYIEIGDVYLMQFWIQALDGVGYEFPKLSYRNPLSSINDWPDMEFFLPIPPIESSLQEFHSRLFWSFRFFFPKPHLNLMMISDSEHADAKAFGARLESEVAPHVNRLKVVWNEMAFPQSGHNRQQWTMFWADNYTSSEYVAFIDTDTVFTGAVLPTDIFHGDKPRVVGVYGEPYNSFWDAVPRSTFFGTGIKERFKAMTYFPVVIKTAHLKLIRDHIQAHLGTNCFDQALAMIQGNGAWSQFNIMLNILYELRHDQYEWHIRDRNPAWTGPVPQGQITSPNGSILPEEMNNPIPSPAIHWTWEKFGKLPPGESEQVYVNVMRQGYCYSLKTTATKPSICHQFHPDETVNGYEWLFEGDDWSQRPGVLEAHMKRRQYINLGPSHDWDQHLLQRVLA